MSLKSVLRSTIYQTEKLAQRLRFISQPADLPVLLGISFPKSGTHLLDQILLGFSNVAPYAKRVHSFYAEYEGESGRKRSPEQALAWLDSLRPRDVASAHLFARPEAVSRFARPSSRRTLFSATRATWSSRMFSTSPTWRRAMSTTIIINRCLISTHG